MIIIAFLAGIAVGSLVTLAFILYRYKLRVKAHRVNTIRGEWRFGVDDLFNERFVSPPEYAPMYHPMTKEVIAYSVDSQADLNKQVIRRYNDQV